MNPVVAAVISVVTAASSVTTPLANPPQSIPPTAAFATACYGKIRPTAACNRQAVANIDAARHEENLGPIVLPPNYSSLGIKAKLAAVTNAERTARGLSSLPLRAAWSKLAQQGAAGGTDPYGPSGYSWGSIWAGIADPLAADYLWMYDDGPNGANGDCLRAGDPGCWGHRDNILGTAWTGMGSGASSASVAELFVGR